MHERHDPDLIAAYADGSLDIDPSEAERLIETCTDCRTEYELQRQVAAALGAAPPPRLTEVERDRLRSGVLEAIAEPAPVVDLTQRRLRRWAQLGAVAAAVLALVGVVGILTQMGGGDTAASFDDAGAELQADSGEAKVTATTAAEASDLTAAADDAAAGDGDDSTEAGIARTEEAAPLPPVVDLGPVDRQTLLSELDSLAARLEPDRETLTVTQLNRQEQPVPACLEATEEPVLLVTATVDGRPVEAYLDAEGTPTILTASDCQPLE